MPELFATTAHWLQPLLRLRKLRQRSGKGRHSENLCSSIAMNGSFFHTQRMVLQSVRNAYLGVEH
jgi:hypothetical protein